MKRILFPTEFSPHAPQIFQYALAIADVYRAEIHILNALNLELYPQNDTNTTFEEEADRTMDKLLEFKQLHQPKEMGHVPVKYITEIGFAADVILRVAEREEMDLIVMGSQGNTRDSGKQLGGAAGSVIGQANCPVLFIPPTAVYKGFQRMACTTNFSFQDLIVFATLKNWAKKFKSKVEALHVIEDRDQLPSIQKKLDLLKDLFENYFHFVLQAGDVTENIEDYVAFNQPDILAMVHRQQSFLYKLIAGDVTETIANEITVPLLVFNEV